MTDYIKIREELTSLINFIAEAKKKGLEVPEGVTSLVERVDKKLYISWDCDESHVFKCNICPRNAGFKSEIEVKYPCGQQHCWVDVTCHPTSFK